jgi:methionyl-tRNA formyltransferase
VKAAALELGIPVSHSMDDVLRVGAELGVVVAFGRLIPAGVLDELPMVNLHFSLLPRWRGAAPVERALLAGDAVTGVAVMAVANELDSGAVYASREVPIGPRATLGELREELVDVGIELLLTTLSGPLPTPVPQSGEVTVAAKLRPEELHLDWTRTAVELDRVVRIGGAWTTFRGRRLKVLAAEPVDDELPSGALATDGRAGTASGSLRLVQVHPEGQSVMAWPAFANGARPQPGERLGEPLQP